MNDRRPSSASRRLADARAFFDPQRLAIGRRLRGLRKNQLAALVGTTPTAVGQYEAGTHRPSERTLSQLALALGVPVEFFTVGHGARAVDSAHAHFRSLRSTSQIERDQALSHGHLAAGIVALLEHYVELPDVSIPEYPVWPEEIAGEGPIKAARLARQLLNVPRGPIRHVVRLLEQHGVVALHLPPVSRRLDAFSVSAHPRPLVLLNPAKGDYYRNRFDGGHELGHLIMHADAEPGSRIVEDQAHRFAAEFLMPEEEIAEQLPAMAQWDRLAALKAQWGVSMAALLYRGRTLGIMRDVTYRNAMSTMSSRGWRQQEPGVRPPLEQPTLLTKAVELLTEAGIGRDALAEQAHVSRGDFDLLVPERPYPPPAL
ncbi:XRE family transcriptional regulator [Nonomuraea sp. NPDC050643]|uniref:helix-turn-helix domain-containing protein n=1 Tax=Nonomuraea sp. NPDC050643 TaxID=3155660 RepID=UPI0033CED7FD